MKRTLSLIIAVIMLASIIPIAAINVAAGDGGSCGLNASWSFSTADGVLRIEGYGAMYDYDDMGTSAPWMYYSGEITNVEISDGITSIGDYSFAHCRYVTTANIPDSVYEIGNAAFFDCTSLESVSLPEGITAIHYQTFRYCSCLAQISLPSTLEVIGEQAFEYCYSLKSIYIPANVYDIYEYAFIGCSGLETIQVDPDNEIYDSRNNCNAIIDSYENALVIGCKNTVIPDSIVFINNGAFYANSSITSMVIPEGVVSISYEAFKDSQNLVSITIPKSVLYIYDSAFCGCSSLANVTYNGSKTDWMFVYVYGENNDELLNANFTYKGGSASPKKGWNLNSTGWFYVDNNGTVVKNQWMKDSKGWCYLGYDGYMVTNQTVQDSHGWCLVDASGYWVTKSGWNKVVYPGSNWIDWVYVGKGGYLVTDSWMKDSKGWCFLNDWGYMATNTTVQDSHGWCYVDKSGYWVTKPGWQSITYEGWDYKDWVYIGKDGYLITDSWMKDSKGWCFLDEWGYMARACEIADSKGICYVDDNGYWRTDSGFIETVYGTIYIKEGGYLAISSWVKDGNDYYYFDDFGSMWRNCTVDEGNAIYALDEEGRWIQTPGWYDIGYEEYCTVYVLYDGSLATNCWMSSDDGRLCWLNETGRKVYGMVVYYEAADAFMYVDYDGYLCIESGLKTVPVWDDNIYDYANVTIYVNKDYSLACNETRLVSYIAQDDTVNEQYKIARETWEFDENCQGTYISRYYDWISYTDFDQYGFAVG